MTRVARLTPMQTNKASNFLKLSKAYDFYKIFKTKLILRPGKKKRFFEKNKISSPIL